MTQPINIRAEYWAVEVPVVAFGFQIFKEQPLIIYYDIIANRGEVESRWIQLPPGSWQIICTTKDCTEDIAAGIVEGRKNAYVDYTRDFNGIPLRMFTAIESLQSLLKSLGLNGQNYLILKKQ